MSDPVYHLTAGTTFVPNQKNITDEVLNDIVGKAQIKAKIITVDLLADNAVETAIIKDGNVTTAKLEDGAVTEAKLADGAVTGAKIADEGITAEKLAAGAVTRTSIADISGLTAGWYGRVRIDAKGFVVETRALASVLAQSASDQTVTSGADYEVDFAEVLDVAGNYSGRRFTAPRAGVYLIGAQVSMNDAFAAEVSWIKAVKYTLGVPTVLRTVKQGITANKTDQTLSVQLIAQLAANEQVGITARHGGTFSTPQFLAGSHFYVQELA